MLCHCHFQCMSNSKERQKKRLSTFLPLIESWEDKQVSRCSLARAWERRKREQERQRKWRVSGFSCFSAYLTNDKKIKGKQGPDSRNGEHREERRNMRVGEATTYPRVGMKMRWWEMPNEKYSTRLQYGWNYVIYEFGIKRCSLKSHLLSKKTFSDCPILYTYLVRIISV